MKNYKIILFAITTLVIGACHTHKNTTNSTAVVTSNTPTKSSKGIFTPGTDELIAMQAKYKDITLDKLKEGYSIYTNGACINCHKPKSIYAINSQECESIIDDMAHKARLTDNEKDAVLKYVLSIKATQSK